MTYRRMPVVSSVFMVLAAASAAAPQELPVNGGQRWQIAGAFPLSEPGPLERSAKPITPDNPIPRRTRLIRPSYPPEAAAVGARASVTLRVTVDHLGTVSEVRTLGVPVLGAFAPGSPADDAAFTAALQALVRSAKDAVGQWVYDPPADAPIAFDVVIGFSPEEDGKVVAQGGGQQAPVVTPQTDGVARVGSPEVPRPPAKVKHVNPVYPAAARDAKISGVVILEGRIEADGRVGDVRVLRSIPALDAAAVEAVRQWEFTPTLFDGVASPVMMTMTVQFSLH